MTLVRCLSCMLVAVVLLSAAPALAEPGDITGSPEFSFGIGYANITLEDTEAIDGESALKIDPVISFSPFQALPQLRLGASFGVSMVLDNSARALIVNDGGALFVGSSDVPFVLFQPEARLSWRQTFGKHDEFFIEPGIGFGGALGWLDIESETDPDDTYSESDFTWQARAFLYIGGRVEGGTFGVEMSYMRGGDLSLAKNVSGEVSEFYIGIFGALQF